MANHPGRKYKEVFFSLGGTQSAVYATEVSLEEYYTFTTEESEKMELFATCRQAGQATLNWLSRGLQKANVIPNHQQLKNQEHEKNNSPYGGMPLLHRQRIRTVGGVRPRQLAQGIINTTKQIVQTSTTAKNTLDGFMEAQKIFQQGKKYYDALKAVHDVVKAVSR